MPAWSSGTGAPRRWPRSGTHRSRSPGPRGWPRPWAAAAPGAQQHWGCPIPGGTGDGASGGGGYWWSLGRRGMTKSPASGPRRPGASGPAVPAWKASGACGLSLSAPLGCCWREAHLGPPQGTAPWHEEPAQLVSQGPGQTEGVTLSGGTLSCSALGPDPRASHRGSPLSSHPLGISLLQLPSPSPAAAPQPLVPPGTGGSCPSPAVLVGPCAPTRHSWALLCSPTPASHGECTPHSLANHPHAPPLLPSARVGPTIPASWPPRRSACVAWP